MPRRKRKVKKEKVEETMCECSYCSNKHLITKRISIPVLDAINKAMELAKEKRLSLDHFIRQEAKRLSDDAERLKALFVSVCPDCNVCWSYYVL